MSKFKFICDNEEAHRYTQVCCDAEHIDEVIEHFEEFLRGCGFYFSGQITRYDPEPKAAQSIRVDEIVSQPFATDHIGLGPKSYVGGEKVDPKWEGHDW